MKKFALVLISIVGCGSYPKHPIATVAAYTVLATAPVGICVGIGECGGDRGGTWQNTAAGEGIAQISVIAVIVASTTLACLSPDAWKY